MKKILFIPFEACLDDDFNPTGLRFEKAKAQIEFAFATGWRPYLIRANEWGQIPATAELDRYGLSKNRWGIGLRSAEESTRDLTDRMEALQPANRPVMRALFCPNTRNDLPTECYQIRFNYPQSMSNIHYSTHPRWAAIAADGPGNNAFRLPGGGMMKTILESFDSEDCRASAVWHQECDRVSASTIGVPLFSSEEWLSGVDPYDRSVFIKNTNDSHWKTNQRPSFYG